MKPALFSPFAKKRVEFPWNWWKFYQRSEAAFLVQVLFLHTSRTSEVRTHHVDSLRSVLCAERFRFFPVVLLSVRGAVTKKGLAGQVFRFFHAHIRWQFSRKRLLQLWDCFIYDSEVLYCRQGHGRWKTEWNFLEAPLVLALCGVSEPQGSLKLRNVKFN